MTEVCALSEKGVPKCDANTPLLSEADLTAAMRELPEWQVSEDGMSIARRVSVKGFAKAVYLANLASFLADRAGHHPDVSFGWGYCELRFTTHEAGGLTEGDVICAAKFDAALAD
jgi:4a-hydroxytetrahydrobiopterin dehydratase